MKKNLVSVALSGALALSAFGVAPVVALADENVQAVDQSEVGTVSNGYVGAVDEAGEPVLSAQALDTSYYGLHFYGYNNGSYTPYNGSINFNTYKVYAKNAAAELAAASNSTYAKTLANDAIAAIDSYVYNNSISFEANVSALESILTQLRYDLTSSRGSSTRWTTNYYDVYLPAGYSYWDYDYNYWDRYYRDWRYDRYGRYDYNYNRRYYDRYYGYSSYDDSKYEKVDVYRLVNSKNGDHIYTTSTSDRDAYIKDGWTPEGTAWQGRKSSDTPVYQLTNPKTGKHFYTKSKTERDNLVKDGWSDNGTAFYSDDSHGIEVFRMCNSIGDHFYTKSSNERDSLVASGWVYEGVGFYAVL